MGRGRHRHRFGNRNARRQDGATDRSENDGAQNDRRGNYTLAKKENERFEKYYQGQQIVPEGQFPEFLNALKEPLPATFRITGSKGEAREFLKVIESDYLQNLVDIEIGGVTLDAPQCLPWYPDGLAWQLNLERKVIRSCDALGKLKTFLVSETESGNISRQEAVSMIPPLLLDIQPHHKILDMCAAPGSKTAQLVEFLHADENNPVPEGFVVANDSDNKRCYLMTHQVKRLASPCFMIINHDASQLPNFRLNPEGEFPKKWLNFDRVLADVPCSGDGTMRKNPDVWKKWNPAIGHNLHGGQNVLFDIECKSLDAPSSAYFYKETDARILKRGLEVLEVGGRLVYSTCSFNPIENEAVVAYMLQKCEGAVQLLDVSEQLPGLKYNQGLTSWKVMYGKTEDWYSNFQEVPEKLHTQIRPTMFPPSEDQITKLSLNRCIRVLPNHQNTGGFFIAVMEKVKQVPWFNRNKMDNIGDEVNLNGNQSTKGSQPAESESIKSEKNDEVGGKLDAAVAMEPDNTNANKDSEPIKSENKDNLTASGESQENKDEDSKLETETKTDPETITVNSEKQVEEVNADDNKQLVDSGTSTSKPGDKRKESDQSDRIFNPPQKKRKLLGYKEDPFIFLDEEDPFWAPVKSFFGIKDSFPKEQLMVRGTEGRKRNIYFTSKEIKTIVQCNVDRIKFINLGIKVLNRSESRHVDCDFRLVQDGIKVFEPYIMKRRITITKEDIITILGQECPFIAKCTEGVQTQLKSLEQGGNIFIYEPEESPDSPQCRLVFCGWKGKTSTRSFLPKYQRSHFLRLCGSELKVKQPEGNSKDNPDPFGENPDVCQEVCEDTSEDIISKELEVKDGQQEERKLEDDEGNEVKISKDNDDTTPQTV